MSAPTLRRLLVVRHAQAQRIDLPEVDDHDRPLTERGRRDARALGGWLAATVGSVDLVLCSSALRTRQTWQLAAAELTTVGRTSEPVLQVRPELYLASPGTVLAVVRQVGADVHTLVVVGHEPVQSTLTQALAGPGSTQRALTGLAAGFSTCAAALLESDGPWDALAPLGPRLVKFAVLRG